MLNHQNANLCVVHLKNGDVTLTCPDTGTVPVGLETRNEDTFFTLGKKCLPQNYSPPESSAVSCTLDASMTEVMRAKSTTLLKPLCLEVWIVLKYCPSNVLIFNPVCPCHFQ